MATVDRNTVDWICVTWLGAKGMFQMASYYLETVEKAHNCISTHSHSTSFIRELFQEERTMHKIQMSFLFSVSMYLGMTFSAKKQLHMF